MLSHSLSSHFSQVFLYSFCPHPFLPAFPEVQWEFLYINIYTCRLYSMLLNYLFEYFSLCNGNLKLDIELYSSPPMSWCRHIRFQNWIFPTNEQFQQIQRGQRQPGASQKVCLELWLLDLPGVDGELLRGGIHFCWACYWGQDCCDDCCYHHQLGSSITQQSLVLKMVRSTHMPLLSDVQETWESKISLETGGRRFPVRL